MHAYITPIRPDLPAGPDTLTVTPDTSIGIAEIRQIQSFLSRKPLQSPHNTVIVASAHLLTLPAQHAFLKTLEEPPGRSQIYLVTSQPDLLLPTILSRCEQVKRSPSAAEGEGEPNPKYTAIFQKLTAADKVGDRLQIIEDQKFDRPSALAFLDSIEHLIHTHIQTNSHLSILNYQLVTDTRRYLKANCTVRLTLDHFALSLNF